MTPTETSQYRMEAAARHERFAAPTALLYKEKRKS